ncbi:MAG: outer membrane protein assembly factor BamA [Deltaproteobacteria bacterium]|nr:outer membrane protein assembly factor BamA [Deltaproteobacteria bacterium]
MTARGTGWFVLLVLLASPWAPAGAELGLEAAQGQRVLRVSLDNRSRVPDPEVRSLFLLHAGDAYDPRVVQRGLTLLGQKPEIRQVAVTGSQGRGGVELTVTVTPEPLVRSIRFEGVRAVPEKDLRPRLRTRIDAPANEPEMAIDAGVLRDLYAEEGYPAARVEPRVKRSDDLQWARVTFQVTEGAPTRVTRVEMPEAVERERKRVLALLDLEEGSVASQKALRAGVKHVLEVYHGDGYPEARAPKARFETDGAGARLMLPLVIGDPVDLRIEGMDEWAARPLRQVMQSRFGEPIDAAWADQVASSLADALRADGYRNVLIAPQVGEEFGRRRVTFHVETGPLVRVGEVTFEGNRSETVRKLKTYMSLVEGGVFRPPPFTQEALDRDLRVLANYYVSQGFLDARVTLQDLEVPPSGSASLKIGVEEGARYRLGRLTFLSSGGPTPEKARTLSGIKEGSWADPGAVEAARVRLQAELAKQGYADASVEVQSTKQPAGAVLDVTYGLRAAHLVHFGKIVVSGNARTQTPVILRELTFQEGDPWSAEEVLLSRQKLFRLGHFQRVRIDPLNPEDTSDVRDVRVSVEEQDSGAISFGGGYGSEEGIKAFAEVSHANLFGSGREAKARADLQGKDWSYVLSFREPWLLGYRNDLGMSLSQQYHTQDAFDLRTTAFRASLDRAVTGHIRGTVVYTLSSNTLSHVAQSADVSSIDQYVLSAVGPVLAWDSRDDPFNPKEGFQHQFQAEWALKALGSQVQYSRYVGSVSGYFSWRSVTLALLARGGFAADLAGEETLPIDKRFFLGGRTSVRGFDRDGIGPKSADGTAVGGDTMVNARAELRFPLWKSLGGDLFWDAGNVWNRKADKPNYLDLRKGAGGGLRYLTPIGPIALDLGFKLDRKEGEAPSAWNFTIGNVF